jgi:hypothetical protein
MLFVCSYSCVPEKKYDWPTFLRVESHQPTTKPFSPKQVGLGYGVTLIVSNISES